MSPNLAVRATLTALLFCAAPTHAGEFLFSSAFLSFPVPESPGPITAGDWNEDGLLDIAVPSHDYRVYPTTSYISILWGRAGGRFEGRSDLVLDVSPSLFATADMDGDEHEDLLVTDSSYPSRVIVLYGDGSGMFPRRSEIPLPQAPTSLSVGPLDGDPYPELVFGLPRTSAYQGGRGGIIVFLNRGNGDFQALSEWESGRLPRVALMDLDSDGVLDLAIGNPYDNTVTVCLGRGDGTFGERREFPTGSPPVALVGSDFNQDSVLDVATHSGTVSVLLGTGGGALGPSTEWSVGVPSLGYSPLGLAATDLNADGLQDIAVGAGDHISVLAGRGDGSFEPPRASLTAPFPYSIVVEDFTGDGVNIVSSASHAKCVALLQGNGDGSFGNLESYPVDAPAAAIVVSDLNRDGALDLAAPAFMGFALPSTDPGFVSIRLGVGDGKFGSANTLATPPNPYHLAAGDLNGDRWPDLVTANSSDYFDPVGTLSVLLATGSGDFAAHREVETSLRNLVVAVGDVTGDQKPDLVAGRGDRSGACFAAPGHVQARTGTNLLSVHPGDGSGAFPTRVELGDGRAFDGVAVADLNGDGFGDMVVSSWMPRPGDGTLVAYFGQRGLDFGPPTTITGGVNPTGIAIADLNGDGRLDIVCANASLCEFEGSVSVMLNQGGGGFAPRVDYAVASNSYSVAIGDLDGDAIPDIAAAASRAHAISVLLGSGDGTFVPRTDYGCGARPWGIAIGDFDRDGRNDLACANYGSRDFGVLRNTGGRPFHYEARAFPANADRTVALAATTARVAIRVEPVGSAFSPWDVDPATIWLTLPGLSSERIRGIVPTSITVDDSDRNGISEVEALFAVADLSAALPDLRHREAIGVSLEGPLFSGALFRASTELTVVGTRSRLRALVSPNPAPAGAALHFRTTRAGPVRVRVFDSHGRLVSTLLREESREPGQHVIPLSDPSAHKVRLSSGIYFYEIEADGESTKGRFAVVR